MRKVSLATIALMPLIAAPALAADMAVKAPPAAAAAYYDLDRIYFGANAGYSVGRDPITVSTITGTAVSGNERFGLSPAGGIAVGQLGYNWQIHRNTAQMVLRFRQPTTKLSRPVS